VAGAYAPNTSVLVFGKPECYHERRMGVVLAAADTVEAARRKAQKSAHTVKMTCDGKKWVGQEIAEKHYK
jgi:phosphoribosylglycinamide formyltransferase 2